MANQDQPNQNANKSKAEGERWSSDENSIRNADRDESPVQQYDGADTDDAGGITNRPLSQEISNQEDLPKRGTARESSGDPNATQPEGDYGEGDE